MTHYIFAEKNKNCASAALERWETVAFIITITALFLLAGITYAMLSRDNIYGEIQRHSNLTRFAAMLEKTATLHNELKNSNGNFTLIAPTDAAFEEVDTVFGSDKQAVINTRVIRKEENSYILENEAFVVRSQVLVQDVPVGDDLQLTAANGNSITLARENSTIRPLLKVNGVPVKERIKADNGVIYLVDSLIYPVTTE